MAGSHHISRRDFIKLVTFGAGGVIVAGWIVFFRLRKVALAASPFRPGTRIVQSLAMATKYCIQCGSLILAEDRFCRSCGAGQSW